MTSSSTVEHSQASQPVGVVGVDLFGWRNALDAADLTAAHHHVALMLSTYMDADGGSCWPSVDTLATRTRRKRATVIKAVQSLEAQGYLEVERGTGTRSSRYFATVPLFAVSGAPMGTTNEDAGRFEEQPAPDVVVTREAPVVPIRTSHVVPLESARGAPRGTRPRQEHAMLNNQTEHTTRAQVGDVEAAVVARALELAESVPYDRKPYGEREREVQRILEVEHPDAGSGVLASALFAWRSAR